MLPRLPITATGTAALVAEAWRRPEFLTAHDACYVALVEGEDVADVGLPGQRDDGCDGEADARSRPSGR